jgi:hypothetical protein
MLAALRRSAVGLVGGLALGGSIWMLRLSDVSDGFIRIEQQLLHSEMFDIDRMAAAVRANAVGTSRGCDTHTQNALVLIEMRLADHALQSGSATDFENYSSSMQQRAEKGLACAPYTSFLWLAAFSGRLAHGQLDQRALEFLSMSYRTSSFEGWLMIRRLALVLPLTTVVSAPLREAILSEFMRCIEDGYVAEAARSYARAPLSAQQLLREQLGRTTAQKQTEFWGTLRNG